MERFSFDKEFEKLINDNNLKDIYVLGHMNPDGDCVGSVMGIAHYLRSEYPRIQVHPYLANVSEKGPKWFLSFEKVFTDPFELDRVEGEYGIIACDTATVKRLIGKELLDGAKAVMAIDHHASHEAYETISCLQITESCADLIYSILDKEKIAHNRATLTKADPTQPTASDYLYLGILHDTSCFKRAKAETLASGSGLLSLGVNHKWLMKTMETTTFEDFEKEVMLLKHADWFVDGKVAGCFCDQKYKNEHTISYDDIHSISGKLRDFSGVEVGFSMYEETPGTFRCSFRSDGVRVNVNELILPYGGGGHAGAAGLKIETEDPYGLRAEIIRKLEEILL